MTVSDHNPAGQGKVMLVEDDPMIRALTAEWIEDAGYTVSEFARGDEALRALREDGDCRVAVLDVSLPDMRGDDLAQALRALQPDLGLLFATGNSDNLSAATLERPRTGLLRKPYSARDLANAIEGVSAD
ncbi:response regulator [Aureimonas sp. SK2]|uniref:response regulator n=1 Tax=Aureimonas sp. SK2 TaxID=3015992 RepID=UPI002443DFB0|nr:response regulator [Aureimonas sp. SK2]